MDEEREERYKHLMARRNQLGNINNPFQQQETYKRVLFVCSAGLLRSATAAHVFSGEPYNWNTRTAGVSVEYALNPVTEALLTWADKVYCMEWEHHTELKYIFGETFNDLLESRGEHFIEVLQIPDVFLYRDTELVKLLKEKISQ
jgi:predicted protein tyrosine phosphatase